MTATRLRQFWVSGEWTSRGHQSSLFWIHVVWSHLCVSWIMICCIYMCSCAVIFCGCLWKQVSLKTCASAPVGLSLWLLSRLQGGNIWFVLMFFLTPPTSALSKLQKLMVVCVVGIVISWIQRRFPQCDSCCLCLFAFLNRKRRGECFRSLLFPVRKDFRFKNGHRIHFVLNLVPEEACGFCVDTVMSVINPGSVPHLYHNVLLFLVYCFVVFVWGGI